MYIRPGWHPREDQIAVIPLFVLPSQLYRSIEPIGVAPKVHQDGRTANLAIFNVLLISATTVYRELQQLTATWALCLEKMQERQNFDGPHIDRRTQATMKAGRGANVHE
jgi:hypothetical protein